MGVILPDHQDVSYLFSEIAAGVILDRALGHVLLDLSYATVKVPGVKKNTTRAMAGTWMFRCLKARGSEFRNTSH